MKRISLNGRNIQQFLNGFLCVFKPRDVSLSQLKNRIVSTICKEANTLEEIIIPEIQMPIVKPHSRTGALVVVGQRKQLDYTMHPLTAGPLLRPEEIYIKPLQKLESSTSGVCVLAINEGCDELEAIQNRAWINEYYLHGELGLEKKNHQILEKIVAKARYDHVTRNHIQKLLTKIKMQYKRLSYEFANVDLQSQEAYELASKGAPRPRILGSPIIYGIELKYFVSPIITLNLQATGENDLFLRAFMHEIGCGLETLACPRRLRRIRQGPFFTDHALLDKHLKLVPILKNIQMSNQIVKAAMLENPDVIEVSKASHSDTRSFISKFKLQEDLACLPEPDDCLNILWGRSYD